MRVALKWALVALLCTTMWAQTTTEQTTTKKTTTKKTSQTRRRTAVKPPAVTAEDIKSLRETLAAQQQQLQQMQQEMRTRDQQLQQTQQQLQQAVAAANEANSKVTAVETAASSQKESYQKLESDVSDVKMNLTNTAAQTQEEQKRMSALESLVGRFRFNGDIRVRQEDFFQDYGGCPLCVPRIRERIRARFGVEGRLSDDFQAGFFLASGTIFDPTSTNETLTSMFEKKTIGLDRAYITYAPKAHSWLSLTGGKFGYTWIRTSQTLDPDLNPEGFSEKLSFDVHNRWLKNVTLTGVQLLFNEVAAPTVRNNAACISNSLFCANGANITGADSFAVGGQLSTRIRASKRVTITPSYMALNWRNENTILNQPASVTGTSGITVVGGTTPVVSLTSSPFAPNGLTNATVRVGTAANGAPILAFLSHYLYGDAILDIGIDTGHAKWPVRIVGEYLQNMRAARVSPNLGKQSHLYKAEASIGQQKNKGDTQFTYGWWRQEQDSVLSAFDESDQRAPTNILQHALTAQYALRSNVSAGYTLWIGRTLNTSLVNARLAPGRAAGLSDPYLKRMQFDVVYKF